MSLTEDIAPYIDSLGLVAPARVVGPRGGDNGTLFLSIYILLGGNCNYRELILTCLNSHGNLCRVPGDTGQDSVDNHMGVFAACKRLGIQEIPREILQSWFKNWGFSNNEVPGTIRKQDGKINWPAFLIRQPQLLCAGISAAGLARWWMSPLYWFAALVIATSCIKAPLSDTDARTLSWLLIKTVSPDSLMCRIASKIWHRRLYNAYGENGMRTVATLYFQAGHPFTKYWEST